MTPIFSAARPDKVVQWIQRLTAFTFILADVDWDLDIKIPPHRIMADFFNLFGSRSNERLKRELC